MEWWELLIGPGLLFGNGDETAQEAAESIRQQYNQAVANFNALSDSISNLRRKYNALVAFRDTLESYRMSFGGDVLYNSSLLTDSFYYCSGTFFDNLRNTVGARDDCSSDSIHGSCYIYSEDLDELESQVSADIAEIDYSINQLAADLLSAESLVNRLWQQL